MPSPSSDVIPHQLTDERMQMKQAEWIAHHRDLGHHPEHSPTVENPDLVRCDCGGIWRILTPEQIRKKFAHLGAIAKKKRREAAEEEQRSPHEKLFPTA
jgi:hypothetical protein